MSAESNLQSIKLDLIQWLLTLEDKAILTKIIDLRESAKQDWWDSISKDEKDAIDRGIKEANAGKLMPHSQARNIYEQWL
jgi:predicted transcriptional regulator